MRIKIMNTNICRNYQLMASIPAISSCIDKRAIKNIARLFTTQTVLYMHYRTLPLWCDGIRRPYSIYRFLQKDLWWRHQMETFSAVLLFVRGIHRSPVNSHHQGQWHGAFMFSLICAWRNGCVNNRDANHDVTQCSTRHAYVVGWEEDIATNSLQMLFERICKRAYAFL